MRLITIGLLLSSVVIGGCQRTEARVSDATAARGPEAVAAAANSSAASVVREVTLPAGTAIPVVLDTSVGSDISRLEQPVRAHVSRAILVNGVTAIPSGSAVSGIVTSARRSGKVKGRAHVSMRFQTISPRGDNDSYRMESAAIGRTAPATKRADAVKIGVPAAGGAIIGGIAGGKKGAAIGTAVGGGAGTAAVLATRGKEVRLGRGAVVTVRLTAPLTVRTRA